MLQCSRASLPVHDILLSFLLEVPLQLFGYANSLSFGYADTQVRMNSAGYIPPGGVGWLEVRVRPASRAALAIVEATLGLPYRVSRPLLEEGLASSLSSVSHVIYPFLIELGEYLAKRGSRQWYHYWRALVIS